MNCTIIPISTLDAPELADYRGVKDRQLTPEFGERAGSEGKVGKFMAEGEIVFRALVDSAYRVLSVLCTPSRLKTIEADLARLPGGTPVYVAEPAMMEALIGFDMHRGLLAIGERRPHGTLEEIVARCAPGRPIVIMEHLANHDNVGGIFRSAAALNAAGIMISPATADPLYRKSLRVSVGCVLKLPWMRMVDWPTGLQALKGMGVRVLALSPREDAVELESIVEGLTETKQRCAILVGAEGPGLTAAAMGLADVLVRIPMQAGVDSLNVSTTAGIVLYRLSGVSGRRS